MIQRSARRVGRHLSAMAADEIVNTASHGLGLAVYLAAGLGLFAWSLLHSDLWRITGVAVYVLSLTFVFAASTVYHAAIRHDLKEWLRKIDHMGVTFMIAGSYTPFLLAHARFGAGYLLLATLWGFVGVGILLQVLGGADLYFRVALKLYLAMGFMLVPFLPLIAHAFPDGALWWVVAGGIAYVIGVVFYLWESLPFGHGVWHLCVIAGSGIHFAAIARFAA